MNRRLTNCCWRGVAMCVLGSLAVCAPAQTASQGSDSAGTKTAHHASGHSSSSHSTVSSKKSRHKSSTHASPKTTSSKGKHSRGKAKSKKARGQQVIDSVRAQQIQKALIREHYLNGEPTGSWDSATQAAMQKYQADQGWQSKTIPDSRALIRLGLGPSPEHLLNPDSAMTSATASTTAKSALPAKADAKANAADPPSPAPAKPAGDTPQQ